MQLPARIGDYTDFYPHIITPTCRTMLRGPENALMPIGNGCRSRIMDVPGLLL